MLRTLTAAIVLSLTLLTSPQATAQPAPHGLRPAPHVIVEMSHAEALHRLHVAQLFAILKRHHDAVLYRAWLAYAAAHAPKPAAYPHGLCGGDLPPCYVMRRESGGSLTAQNPHSTASGKWQFLDSTWAHHGGYSRAMYAPESVQDDRAREVWNHGLGCSAWSAC